MNRIFGFTRTAATNLAQILLIALILPVLAVLCELVFPDTATQNILSWLGNTPVIGVAFDILSQYAGFHITAEEVTSITIYTLLRAFPDAFLTSVCVHICNDIQDLLWSSVTSKEGSFKPFHILSTFIGVILSIIIVNVIGLTGSALTSILIELGVIVIMFIGIRLMFRSLSKSKLFSLTKILVFVADGIFAVTISIYVAGLAFVFAGLPASFGEAARLLIILSVVSFIAAVITYFIRLFDSKNMIY